MAAKRRKSRRQRVKEIALYIALLTFGAACSEFLEELISWNGANSTQTLDFEEALTLTTDTAHNGKAKSAASRLCSDAMRAIQALKQRRMADRDRDPIMTRQISFWLDQLRDELK